MNALTMQRVHASMQRLPCRTVPQLQTLPKPVLPRAPRPITAPSRGPLPVLQPQSQREPAPKPLITSLERLGGGLAHCCPLVLLQLTAPHSAQAARVYLDVPDWLANFHLVDFLLNTPVLTLGLLVLVLRLLPRVLKASVRYLLLPATVILVGWLAISHPQATAATIQAALEFIHDHPVASSLVMVGLAALLLGPQLITGGLLAGTLLLLSAKSGLLQLPSLPSLPQLGPASKEASPGQALVQRAQRLIDGGSAAPATSSGRGSSSANKARDSMAGSDGITTNPPGQALVQRVQRLMGRGSSAPITTSTSTSTSNAAKNSQASDIADRNVVTASSSSSSSIDDASRGSWDQGLPWLKQGAQRLMHSAQGLGDTATSLMPQQQAAGFVRGAQELGAKVLQPQQEGAESLKYNAQELGSKAQALGGQVQELGSKAQEFGSKAQALLQRQDLGSNAVKLGGRAQAFLEQQQQQGLVVAGDGDAAQQASGWGSVRTGVDGGRGGVMADGDRTVEEVLRNS